MELKQNLFEPGFTRLHCDEIAQMVESDVLSSYPATGKLFCTMLQHVTSNRVYKIPTKQSYHPISVYTARYLASIQ